VERTSRQFFVENLWLGLGLVVAGLIVLGIYYLIGVMLHLLLVAALLAVPLGVLMMLYAYTWGCVRCRKQMTVGSIALHESLRAHLPRVLATNDPGALLECLQAAPAATGRPVLLPYMFCPSCRDVAVVDGKGHGSRRIEYTDGKTRELVPLLLAMDPVKQKLARVKAPHSS